MDLAKIGKYFFVISLGFLLADLFTRQLLYYCRKFKITHQPNERGLHTAPTPRLGGIGVFLSFQLVSFSLVYFYGYLARDSALTPLWWYQFLLPASLLVAVGILDDLYDLSAVVKLVGQCVAASLLIWSGTSLGHISFLELHPVVDYLLTLFWFLLVINAFNLIDGLDGLASGIAAIAGMGLFGIFLISDDVFPALMMLAFVGAICGFLRHNFHPAKIFLGDSGSMFLGFSLAAFTLCSPSKGSTVATLGACVLAIGVPLLDTALAVWRRSIRRVLGPGSGVMTADMDHIHHRLVKRGISQKSVALTLYSLSAFLVAIGLLSLLFSSYSHGIYLIAFTFGTYIVVRHLAHVELWDSGAVIARGISRPSAPVVAAILYPVADAVTLGATLLVSIQLTASTTDWHQVRSLLMNLLPIWVGICFLALGLAGTYQRVWSRARVSEFVYLIAAFGLGTVMSAGLTDIVGSREFIPNLWSFTAIFFGLGGGALTGLRSVPRALLDLMFLNSGANSRRDESQKKVLVIGANLLYLKYISQLDWNNSSIAPIRVVGILDKNRNLRKRIVHGYHVLGTPKELPRILNEYTIDEIAIAEPQPSSVMNDVLALGARLKIPVKQFQFGERELSVKEPSPVQEDLRKGA